MSDCSRCNSAGSVEFGVCQVCLAEDEPAVSMAERPGALPAGGSSRRPLPAATDAASA